MRIDNYTRFLLTTITLCLLYVCAKDFARIPKVHADSPMQVVLVGKSGEPPDNEILSPRWYMD